MPRYPLSLAATAALLALSPAAPFSLPPAMAQDVQTVRLPVVSVATASPAAFQQHISLTGSLVPREEVQVGTPAAGEAITVISADLGDKVAQGQVLAQLDDRRLRAQLSQAEAEYARAEAALRQARSTVVAGESALRQAEQTLQRMVSLSASGAATRAKLEEAEAAAAAARASDASNRDGIAVAEATVELNKAARTLAQKNLDDATIVAPVAGVISARSAQLGQVVVAGAEPLFRILRDGEIELSARAIESEIAQITPGQSCVVTVAGDATLTGRVRLVSPTIDPASRMGTLRIALSDPQGRARAGMFAVAKVMVQTREGLSVPSSAVMTDASEASVLVVADGNVLERRIVTTGLYWQGRTEILAGLKAGETVVAKASAFFATGDRVSPAQQAQTLAAEGTR